MDNSLKTFINLVMNENLVQAQHLIKEKLNEALTNALNEKYESFAPTIFEDLDPVGKEDEDIDNNGKVDETDKYLENRRAAIGNAIEGEDEDEAEDEEQLAEEEEGGSEEEEDEEDDQDSEETDEEKKD